MSLLFSYSAAQQAQNCMSLLITRRLCVFYRKANMIQSATPLLHTLRTLGSVQSCTSCKYKGNDQKSNDDDGI